MHLGMPVVVLQTTEAATLPAEIGAVSLDLDKLRRRTHELLVDPDDAARCGRVAREVALQRYSLAPFLNHWDDTYARAFALPVGVPRARALPPQRGVDGGILGADHQVEAIHGHRRAFAARMPDEAPVN